MTFYQCTLYRYFLTAYYEPITFLCINSTYVSFMYCTYKLLLLLPVQYWQESFCTMPIIMTSSISTLVDLWNAEKMNEWMNGGHAMAVSAVCIILPPKVWIFELRLWYVLQQILQKHPKTDCRWAYGRPCAAAYCNLCILQINTSITTRNHTCVYCNTYSIT